MNDQRREILSQVAAGTITAAEGAARLEALETDPPLTASQPTAGPPVGVSPIKQVRLLTRLGNTEILGDPGVSGAVADGQHSARQEGDTLVIEQATVTEETGFSFGRASGRISINGVDVGRKLTVRMNPALALAATVQAGNLRIAGVEGPITGEIQAGNLNINGFRGPLKLAVSAGNVNASGRLEHGDSAIRCEMGSVKVLLEKGSNVRVRARATMGKVAIEGDGGRDANDMVVGTGAGRLDIDCTMGSVRVAVQ